MNQNIQLFRTSDAFSSAMGEIATQIHGIAQRNIWKLKDEFATSVFFGEFLWDNKLFDLARYFSRRYWSMNYEAIIRAMEVAGTYEAYIIVVESAMGKGRITFETPAPSHLIINVSGGDIIKPAEARLADESLAPLTVDGPSYPGAVLEFVDSASNLTFQETAKLIEMLVPNGVFVEIKSI